MWHQRKFQLGGARGQPALQELYGEASHGGGALRGRRPAPGGWDGPNSQGAMRPPPPRREEPLGDSHAATQQEFAGRSYQGLDFRRPQAPESHSHSPSPPGSQSQPRMHVPTTARSPPALQDARLPSRHPAAAENSFSLSSGMWLSQEPFSSGSGGGSQGGGAPRDSSPDMALGRRVEVSPEPVVPAECAASRRWEAHDPRAVDVALAQLAATVALMREKAGAVDALVKSLSATVHSKYGTALPALKGTLVTKHELLANTLLNSVEQAARRRGAPVHAASQTNARGLPPATADKAVRTSPVVVHQALQTDMASLETGAQEEAPPHALAVKKKKKNKKKKKKDPSAKCHRAPASAGSDVDVSMADESTQEISSQRYALSRGRASQPGVLPASISRIFPMARATGNGRTLWCEGGATVTFRAAAVAPSETLDHLFKLPSSDSASDGAFERSADAASAASLDDLLFGSPDPCDEAEWGFLTRTLSPTSRRHEEMLQRRLDEGWDADAARPAPKRRKLSPDDDDSTLFADM